MIDCSTMTVLLFCLIVLPQLLIANAKSRFRVNIMIDCSTMTVLLFCLIVLPQLLIANAKCKSFWSTALELHTNPLIRSTRRSYPYDLKGSDSL
ncbi:hypothetical protein FGIG_12426 [Fasciola gigantica]|uniref:Uncharacterized protein n=1 Tax=Fasciola gigantica TaxID=46835 RepID=A0A504YTR7_FASGI|nr:hypothetical protein FGIG_12426 [Fasciola gigantica]